MKINITHLYPDLLNLYGDRGNIMCMKKRLEWRGIEAEITSVLSGEKANFNNADIVLLGGGQDREQELVCKYLSKIKSDFKAYAEDGGVILALCGGYQLLGNYYKTKDRLIDGLDILDIYTEWEPKRLVSNIVLKSPLFKDLIVGFENHGGRTYIGNHTPFGKVLYGFGNTDSGSTGAPAKPDAVQCEGAIYKNVIGTYLHGPLLPKNPEVCDFLLTKAIERKYGSSASFKVCDFSNSARTSEFRKSEILSPLSDTLEHRANNYMVKHLIK